MAYQTHAPWGAAPSSYVRDEGLLLVAEGLQASGKVSSDDQSPGRRYSGASSQRPVSEATRPDATDLEDAVDEDDEIEDQGPQHMTFRQSFAQSWQSPAANAMESYSKVAHLAPPGDIPQPGHALHEQTPLLRESVSKESLSKATPRQAIKEELTLLLKWSAPICITHLLELSLVTVTVISVGHLGTLELAAASLASMTCNVVALSFIQGAASALDTLCPQAYTSARPTLTGLHAVRTMIIICLMIIPQWIIFFNATNILIALKQEPEVAELAGQYLKVVSAGLPGYALFEVVRRWLQSQGLMRPPTFVVSLVAPINIVLNYVLVWLPPPIGRGFVGAPLASAISMDLMGLLLLLYAIIWAPKHAWCGLSMDVFRNWGINISLGISGILMSASEWWSWEIAALAASLLGPIPLASQSVLLITTSIFYQTAFASSSAAAVRMGNLVGANQPQRARLAARVSVVYGIGLGFINMAILLVNKSKWGRLFSNDNKVVDLVGEILPIVALFQVFDSGTGLAGGLMRGCGRSAQGAGINLASYYVIGMPIGLYLTFSHYNWGLYGLWIGLNIALACTFVLMIGFALNVDYEKEARLAKERADETAAHPV